jgi:transposase
MSTSLLYNGFGIRGYRYVRTNYVQGEVEFVIDQDRRHWRCSACGSRSVRPKGRKPREFRCVSIGTRPVTIRFDVPRVKCLQCGKIRQVQIAFADPRRRYTKAFRNYVLSLAQCMTILDVSLLLNVSWGMIKEIQKEHLGRRFGKPSLKGLRRIAIDEIAVRKGHRYLTVVLDLESGRVVFVGDGRGSDTLKPFWTRVRRSRAKIEAVATDMSWAYISAISENLPEAEIVCDRFHVVKLLNEKLTDLRRELHRTTTSALEKQVLKGIRWLLLKRPENLDQQRSEHQRLEEALQVNKPLALAYYLKEQLGEFWELDDRDEAEAFLLDWIALAEASGIAVLISFARTLRLHALRLLAWYDYPISTGPLEGVNNKIKTLKRQAYGYRDDEFFRLKIFALHETRYALVG